MTSGPDHYREAEDLAHDARTILEQQTPHTAEAANAGSAALAALAQVHATLAQVALAADFAATTDVGPLHSEAWREVTR